MNLEPLVSRFDAMAEVRENHAAKKRAARSSDEEIAPLEAAAQAYRRCADEVRRVLAGEIPPPPDHRWD